MILWKAKFIVHMVAVPWKEFLFFFFQNAKIDWSALLFQRILNV